MTTVRRLAFGIAFLTVAVLLAQHSANLPRTAWFARTNYMAGSAACVAAILTLLMQSLKVSPNRFNVVWWKVAPVLAFVGVLLIWGSLIAFPRMASKPIVWFLNIGCTLCLFALLRIRTWSQSAGPDIE